MSATYRNLPLPDATPPGGTEVATSLAFTEGPAVAADGTVYFSDIENNRIMQYSPSSGCQVFRQPSGRTNGQTFDQQGRLYHCEGAEFGDGGNRRVTRTTLSSGEYEVLTDHFDGMRYNSPNDICIDGLGRIYFTDPRYGDRGDMEMEIEGVYRIDLDGTVTRIIEQPVIDRPNGIVVTQDSSHLYLVDSCPTPGGNRKIWHFDLDAEGNADNPQVVIDFGSGRGGDGMRIDQQGNLYIAAGISSPRGDHETDEVPPGIYVVSPEGALLSRIPITEDVLTNLAWGGSDGRTLYITAGKTLFTTRVGIPGQVAYPSWQE